LHHLDVGRGNGLAVVPMQGYPGPDAPHGRLQIPDPAGMGIDGKALLPREADQGYAELVSGGDPLVRGCRPGDHNRPQALSVQLTQARHSRGT